MNRKLYFVLPLISIIILSSFGCNLLNLVSGGNSGDKNSGSSSPNSESVDMDTLVADVNVSSQRTDSEKFADSKFIGHSFPVEVSINGDDAINVLYSGGYYSDDLNVKPPAPQFLNVKFVLQKDYSDYLTLDSDTNKVKMNFCYFKFTMDLYDASGNLIENEFASQGELLPNLVQVFTANAYGNMENVAKAKINITVGPSTSWTEGDLSAEDLDFVFPREYFTHSPVKYFLEVGKFSAQYEQEGVMARYHIKTQNPYNALITGTSEVLFINDEGLLVGYMEQVLYLEPNGLADDTNQSSSYLSGVPTRVMVIDRVDNLNELIISAR